MAGRDRRTGVRDFFNALFGVFLSWWGTFVLAALDSSLFFFLPFGIDAVVIYLAARDADLFWLYPLLAAAGSVVGGSITYWIGATAGEAGLSRLAPKRRLARVKTRVKHAGAFAMALPAALPPPFPLTPFILTCGALGVSRSRLFAVFATMRVLRFGVEALLARRYGKRVIAVLESDWFQLVIGGFIILAIVGTVASAVVLWRRTKEPGSVLRNT